MSVSSVRSEFALASTLALVVLTTTPASAQMVNELVFNHTGADTMEYVEVSGAPTTDYSDLAVIVLEGDVSAPGTILRALPVGSTDAHGYWTTGFLAEQLENGSQTTLLVRGFGGTVGSDLDTNNDGTLDSTPWTELLDAVAVRDTDTADPVYAATVLAPYFDGIQYTPGGASRIPDSTDTGTVSDWRRNDFDGCGLPGLAGALDPVEACNTPGASNRMTPPPPLLNELVADHVGAPDDHEYVEVKGTPLTDYSTACIAVILGDVGAIGVVDRVWTVGTTSAEGYWTTGFLTDEVADTTITVILAEWSECTLTIGDDLDADDDGVLDAPPWTVLHDDLALTDGGAGDVVYSATVLGPVLGGASRIPDGADSDAATDWLNNDFDGAGLDGFPASDVDPGEAFNTPGRRNRVGLVDYYAGVDASSAAALRASLHEVIDDHQRFPYTASTTDTWDILNSADQDPNDPANILDVYKNASYLKITGGTGAYNREHSWPNSYGFPIDGPTNFPYTDCHHLFASDTSYNSDRGNMPFRECATGCTERPTLANNGTGGDPGSGYPGYSNWFAGSSTTGSWETWIGRRGDVARAQLYMDLRYEGGVHGITGAAEPDLILTDDAGLISSTPTGSNEPVAYMGELSVLLAWHWQDPPDDLERRRNDVVASYQGNRNPFVDHPEWVRCLYENDCEPPLFADGFESGLTDAWSTVVGAP